MKSLLTRTIVILAILAGLTGTVSAQTHPLVVEDAWARASMGMNRPGAAYMTIRNSGEDIMVLVGLRTDIAVMPEIHLTSTDDRGVSSMTPAGEIEIAPGGAIALEPGGLHAMLMQLQRPMVDGETFQLTLVIANGDDVTVEVPIRGFAARGPQD